MRGRTVIAIAHRLSTVRSFDRIIVLQAGQIVQDGPPDKLMIRPGLYRELIDGGIEPSHRAGSIATIRRRVPSMTSCTDIAVLRRGAMCLPANIMGKTMTLPGG